MRAELLLALCVLLYLPHEAAMPLIPPMQRPEVTATVEPDDENQNYHICDQHECNQCPAGYYVSRSCTCPDTDVTCQPCQNGTFSKYSNSLNRCFFCQVCRPLDQVEIKKCTATTNTECACKNGTFCDPNYACETCQTCRKSCPPGQKKVQDCTPTSDMQCHPAPTSSTPTGSPGSEHLLWVLLSLSGLIVLAMALFCWQYSRLKNAQHKGLEATLWGRRNNFHLFFGLVIAKSGIRLFCFWLYETWLSIHCFTSLMVSV